MKNIEHKVAAAFTFLSSLVIYIITLAPTVSFWDCGEFIACSITLGIPHPPGAPLYLLMGKFFSLMPFGTDPAFEVNLVSAFSSAFTILFLYLIIVRLIKEFIDEQDTFESKLGIYLSGVIGALTFAFTDTFWFNASEAEVYAVSMLFTSAVFWLALKWMDNFKEISSLRYLVIISYLFGLAVGVHLLNLLVVPSILILIYFYDRKIFLNYRLWSIVIFLMGFAATTYVLIYIRSGLGPAINENDPSNFERFWSYWNREQYGNESLFTTVFDRKAPFWAYQIKKMYLRYFAWNFMGQGTTLGADRYIVETFSSRGLFYLPFLLGLTGIYYHFKHDWKRALSVLIMFIVTGIALVIYLNQPDPQPRERDYVYVGSFFAFAIWIGMGVAALFQWAGKIIQKIPVTKNLVLGVITALVIIMGPFIQLRHNFHTHDRRGSYMAWDYSFNLLESTEPNSILFTNGDNDTFPLWYLQEVEGIRKDVSVVNLSLLNTPWYIKQLKNHINPVPISFTNDQIEMLTPREWKEQTISIPVSVNAYNTLIKEAHESYNLQEINQPTEISFSVKPTFINRAIRVQDLMILNIINTNQWRRPVFFAMTIPVSNKVGIDSYLQLQGLAMKVVPYSGTMLNIDALVRNLTEKFQYRGLADPSVYLDRQKRDLLQNIRFSYYQAAEFYHRSKNYDETLSLLTKMEEVVPKSRTSGANYLLDMRIGMMYNDAGQPEILKVTLDNVLARSDVPLNMKVEAIKVYAFNLRDLDGAVDQSKKLVDENPTRPEGYSILITLLERQKSYQDGVTYLDKWISFNPNDNNAKNMKARFESLIANPDTSGKK